MVALMSANLVYLDQFSSCPLVMYRKVLTACWLTTSTFKINSLI